MGVRCSHVLTLEGSSPATSYQYNGADVTALPGPVGVGVFRSCDWGVCAQATKTRNYLGFL
jgi:hypothetical protein